MTAQPGGGVGAAVVVVSPHLDDAVLSAAAQLLRPGARVVTVCAAEPAADAPPGYWDALTGADDARARVRARLREDEAAFAELGVRDPVRLGFPDGQHVGDSADRPTRAALVAGLRPHLAGATEVWAPAGIGCHPDHVAVRDAAVAAVAEGTVVHHYADVPYALRYGWPPSVTGAAPWSPYLDVEAWLAEELAEAELDHLLGRPGAQMRRTVHQLDPDAQRRKVAAMNCYATQMPALDYGHALGGGDPAVVGFEVSWSRP